MASAGWHGGTLHDPDALVKFRQRGLLPDSRGKEKLGVMCIHERVIDSLPRISTLYSMKTRARKWGNSLALRLPKVLATSLKIEEGTELELEEHEDGILLRPVRTRYELGELLKGIRKNNLPESHDFGQRQGKEAW